MRSLGEVGGFALFATLGHHHELLRRWLPYTHFLLNRGRLPARDRELVVLRTAVNCEAEYEWSHHSVMALEAGLTTQEVEMIAAGGFRWTARDQTILDAVDELCATGSLGEAAWDSLAEIFDDVELIELFMLVGQYLAIGLVVNALRVPLDPGYAGWPERQGGSNSGPPG